MSCPHSSFIACYECRGDELVSLRVQLADATDKYDHLIKAVGADHDITNKIELDLRAQLAAVTKERDAIRADNADLLAYADAYELMLTQVGRERDALKVRVAALEAALEPTVENLNHYAGCSHNAEEGECIYHNNWRARLVRIRDRAGFDAKEGG